MRDGDVLARFRTLRQHRMDGKRSPHKPLLVLTALGRLVDRGSSATPFTAVEEQLAGLVAAFGRPGSAGRASATAYPFTRLRSDGIWRLSSDVPMDLITPLRDNDVVGSFTPDIERALLADPVLLREVAHRIAVSQFPPTIVGDVLAQVGLDPTWGLEISVPQYSTDRRRRASWVREILLGWDRQCAFCGYDGQLGDAVVGIEAAHVRWFNTDGPDDPDNGLALCSLHHKLFDRGALGIDDEYRVKISPRLTARTLAGKEVYALAGRPLRPRPGSPLPAPHFVTWHDVEVFKVARAEGQRAAISRRHKQGAAVAQGIELLPVHLGSPCSAGDGKRARHGDSRAGLHCAALARVRLHEGVCEPVSEPLHHVG